MTITLLQGDCREILPTLPDCSVQCVVTSPPYFGLRDYGTGTWAGGDPACDHRVGQLVSNASTLRADGRAHLGPYAGEKAVSTGMPAKDLCPKCGATRIDSQIGLEASPAAYVAEMVAVFREVKRVLRDDGTVWLNLGDSMNAAGRKGHGTRVGYKQGTNRASATGADNSRASCDTLKEKDLLMIPARVAIALQDDGWYLRSDIIWAKPNPMPESVTDRPTSAHEHVFLLTKSPRYFYDAEAVREADAGTDHARNVVEAIDSSDGYLAPHSGIRTAEGRNGTGRNLRNVWTIATQPFSGAHSATFPAELVERCIKAGTRPGDTILDPFAGAFTTALVADRLGRDAIGIELSETYCAMARARLVSKARLEPLTPDDPLAQDKAALWSGADLPLFA